MSGWSAAHGPGPVPGQVIYHVPGTCMLAYITLRGRFGETFGAEVRYRGISSAQSTCRSNGSAADSPTMWPAIAR